MITIAFRLDDPSETSNQSVEYGLIEAFRQQQVACTFAIIPFRMVDGEKTPLTSKRAQPLIEAAHAGVIEPALHGYLHIRLAQDMTRPSEFANRSMDEQQRMLHEGRAHLEAIFEQRIHGFVPPWNSYDSTTLEVLRQMEFDYISASWSGVSPREDTLASLPLTAHLAEIPRAIEEARKFKCCNPKILVVMHHYDFVESNSDNASTSTGEFAKLLERLNEQPDISIKTLKEVSELTTGLNQAYRQHAFRNLTRFSARWLPKYSFIDTSPWRCIISNIISC